MNLFFLVCLFILANYLRNSTFFYVVQLNEPKAFNIQAITVFPVLLFSSTFRKRVRNGEGHTRALFYHLCPPFGTAHSTLIGTEPRFPWKIYFSSSKPSPGHLSFGVYRIFFNNSICSTLYQKMPKPILIASFTVTLYFINNLNSKWVHVIKQILPDYPLDTTK